MAAAGGANGTSVQFARHFTEDDYFTQENWKYWTQRYRIFSKYDEGIWMTDDLWFGVTPELIAKKVAEHVATAPAEKTVLIDAFAGAGGNTIQFALSGRWSSIFAVEKDAEAIAAAKHNAELYGVAKKITWIRGDIFEVLKTKLKFHLKNAVIFGSPPWGGPTYNHTNLFNLATMQPYSLAQLQTSFTANASHVVLFLPRTSDMRQVARVAGDGPRLDSMHYCMSGFSKSICLFTGNFDLPEKSSSASPSSSQST